VLDRLSTSIDSDASLDTEIVAALANGACDVPELGSEVGVPVDVLEDHLHRLQQQVVIERGKDGWALAQG